MKRFLLAGIAAMAISPVAIAPVMAQQIGPGTGGGAGAGQGATQTIPGSPAGQTAPGLPGNPDSDNPAERMGRDVTSPGQTGQSGAMGTTGQNDMGRTGTDARGATPGSRQAMESERFDSLTANQFATELVQANMLELQTSRLAVDRARSEEVKQFAQQLITAHQQMQDRLRTLIRGGAQPQGGANNQAGTANTGGNDRSGNAGGLNDSIFSANLDNRWQSELNRLQNVSGAEFDRAYVQTQQRIHDRTIRLLEGYQQNGDHQQLKTFAQESLQKVRQHDQRLDQLAQLPVVTNQQTGPANRDATGSEGQASGTNTPPSEQPNQPAGR